MAAFILHLALFQEWTSHLSGNHSADGFMFQFVWSSHQWMCWRSFIAEMKSLMLYFFFNRMEEQLFLDRVGGGKKKTTLNIRKKFDDMHSFAQ